MKRYGDLYERIISIDNLRLADEHARMGKKNAYGVRLHDRNREENLARLHEQLASGTFRTSKYDVFKIYEPKERLIYRLPYYPDRIVHHAVMNILGGIWRRTFTHNTYACIKGRGIHSCLKHCEMIIRKHKGKRLFCLKIDIKKFYPSVQADVMKMILRKKIKCRRTLSLLDEIIDSAQGLPIGNYLSQYFANLVLAYLMHRINEVEKVECAEYADDMVFFSEDKAVLHRLLHAAIIPELSNLRLELKPNYQVFPIATDKHAHDGRGLDFVGYVLFMECTYLRKVIKQNAFRKARRLHKKGVTGKAFEKAMSSWKGWADHCDGVNLKRKLFTTHNS